MDRNAYLLVKRVYEQTRDGRLDWTPSGMKGRYKANLGPYQLFVREVEDPELPDQPDYAIDLHLMNGDWVDSIFNYSLTDFFEERVDGLNPYGLLKDVHRRAHRSALRVDENLAKALMLLDQEPEERG